MWPTGSTTNSCAAAAGFDGVQVHVAHFFFLSRFVSPAVNHRTDEFGGTTEREKQVVRDYMATGRAEEMLPFALMGWAPCVARTAHVPGKSEAGLLVRDVSDFMTPEERALPAFLVECGSRAVLVRGVVDYETLMRAIASVAPPTP